MPSSEMATYLEILPQQVLDSGSEMALNAVSISLDELDDSLSRDEEDVSLRPAMERR